jgi:hypothetical protein
MQTPQAPVAFRRSDGVIGQQRVHADRVFARQMGKYGLIVERQESLVRAFGALGFRLGAETMNPLVSTGGRVSRPGRPCVFPAPRKDIEATTKPLPEEMDLLRRRSRWCGGNGCDRLAAGRFGLGQRLAKSRNLCARLSLGVGQALKLRFGLVNRLGEEVQLVGLCQSGGSYLACAAYAIIPCLSGCI